MFQRREKIVYRIFLPGNPDQDILIGVFNPAVQAVAQRDAVHKGAETDSLDQACDDDLDCVF